MIKVYDGTPTDKHLCDKCDYGSKRVENNKQIYYCRSVGDRVKGRISQCNMFDDSAMNNRHISKLAQIAWRIDKDEDGEIEVTLPYKKNSRTVVRRRRNPRRKKVDAEFVKETVN